MAGKVIFDCEIRDKGFYKFGSITITEINDAEVKTQFLEGRSEQNFDKTFDKVYINELDLGEPPTTDKKERSPAQAWSPDINMPQCVALPWVNDFSGNIQNLAAFDSNGRSYYWNSECKGLSWQPYLIFLTKRICEAVGYSHDFSKWEQSEQYKYLLVCNTLPHAWGLPGFAHALPHWTVEEYFRKLELFLAGEFDFDHRERSVAFNFSADIVDSIPPVLVENVIDSHEAELEQDDDSCDYLPAKNMVYKECDNLMWKFYSCDWFIRHWKELVVSYDTMDALLKANRPLMQWNGKPTTHPGNPLVNADRLLYAADIDAYFVVRALSKELLQEFQGVPNRYRYKMELRPVNLFGGRIVDDREEADSVEIEFVPAWIDHTEDKFGRLLFLSFSGYDENESTGSSWKHDPQTSKEDIDNTLFQPHSVQALEAGEIQRRQEYYDRIYIAWWDGAGTPRDGTLPHPFAENIEIEPDWSNFTNLHFSLRLNRRGSDKRDLSLFPDTARRLNFKFLSDSLPDPRSVFFIKGKRYICEKLTASFSVNGMSSLVSGVFWPVAD